MQVFTVIFLVKRLPVSSILVLKRAENKKFAPGLCTGIGGKVEPNEDPLRGAYRELEEETGIKDVKLTEFARMYQSNGRLIHGYWGIFNHSKLPKSPDGELLCIHRDRLFEFPFIPSAQVLLTIWQDRKFSAKPFTFHLTGRRSKDDFLVDISVEKIEEGLN